jgi:hypothetical protein
MVAADGGHHDELRVDMARVAVYNPRAGVRQGLLLLVVCAVSACGERNSSSVTNSRRDDAARASIAATADAQLELPALELGLPHADAFAWRTRAGHAAFQIARKSEHRDDWPAVASHCETALAADKMHLEAQWLYAVALAKTGKTAAVLAPLAAAVGGDFAKWSRASLEQPALQTFLGTPSGAAWQRRIDRDRARFVDAIGKATIVIANGDLYAAALERGAPGGAASAGAPSESMIDKRWYRLTHTFGGVVAALPSPDGKQLAYAVRKKPRAGTTEPRVAIGIVDLSRGYTSHAFEPGGANVKVAWTKDGAMIASTSGKAYAVRALDADGHPHPVPVKDNPFPSSGLWLEVGANGVRVHRLPVRGVTADWDDRQLASAIQVGAGNRVVSLPSPALIDGNTIAWSPDRTHLAFVALLDDRCTAAAGENTAVFVADVATGAVKQVARASRGLAVEWTTGGAMVIAGDKGVSIVALDGTVTKIDGATGLPTPRKKPRCAPEVPEDLPEEDVGEPPR